MTQQDVERLNFRKSSRSGSTNGQCIEVAAAGGVRFVVRDSKDKAGPTLAFTAEDLRKFLKGVHA